VLADESVAITASYAAPPASPPPGGSAKEEPPPAPRATIGSHPAKSTRSRSARYTFSSSQNDSSFKCKLDKGHLRACRSPKVYKHLRAGPHTFTVVAIEAGVQGKPAKFSWRVLPKR
jgi:hypothetical protein